MLNFIGNGNSNGHGNGHGSGNGTVHSFLSRCGTVQNGTVTLQNRWFTVKHSRVIGNCLRIGNIFKNIILKPDVNVKNLYTFIRLYILFYVCFIKHLLVVYAIS